MSSEIIIGIVVIGFMVGMCTFMGVKIYQQKKKQEVIRLGKISKKDRDAAKRKALLIMRILGKDYEDHLFETHMQIISDSEELINKALEKEAFRKENETKRNNGGKA